MTVDEMRHELHVVDAVRFAPVEGLVARDEAADLHRARIPGRALGRGLLDDELRRAQRRLGHERRVQHGGRAAWHVEQVAGLVRDDADAAGADRPGGVLRLAVDALGKGGEPDARAVPADAQVAPAVGR